MRTKSQRRPGLRWVLPGPRGSAPTTAGERVGACSPVEPMSWAPLEVADVLIPPPVRSMRAVFTVSANL